MPFTPYIDCDNKNLSIEQIIKKFLLVEDAEGNPALKVITANDALTNANLDLRKTDLTKIKTTVKTGAANLMGWNIINPNATAVYVKFYDKLIADVTVGTTVPILTLMVPANGSVYQQPDCIQASASLGLVVLATSLLADTDTTDVTTPIQINVKYN